MNKKNQIVYSVISLCAVAAYCAFLVTNSISQVDVAEETLPYSIMEDFEEEVITEPVLIKTIAPKSDVPEPVSEPPREIETETEYEALSGFSPVFPILGTVTKYFSLNHTYNPSTGDWRTHSGIDIESVPADPVFACEDGTVTACYQDPLWGNVIEIDHGEYISIYKNLSTLIMVNEGDSVKRGEKISGCGNSAAAEAGESHIHFEIKHYGEYIDPLELLG